MRSYDPIVWNDELMTGVPEIDDQHRILVNTLNEAGVKLTGNRDTAMLEQITRDLLSYALYHFETEESLMAQYAYQDESAADAATHRQQHRSFSAKVVAVRDGLKTGVPISREDLLSFLNQWLINHIMNTDKKLGAYIIARREQEPAV